MFKAQFPKLRAFVVFALIIGATFAYRQWTLTEDIIQIDGKAVQVVDGDSFKSDGEEFRIYGIDAPEYRQICKDEEGVDWPCGKVARSGLENILRQESYNCAVRTRDQFGRLVVLCTSNIGSDLSAQLVGAGLAISGQNFDEILYATDELDAKKAKKGIWQGKFTRPNLWREQNPRS